MLILKSRMPSLRQRIAVVEMYGAIGSQIKSPPYGRIFTDILNDPGVKAVVLDIDSPGGEVAASDYLYRSIAKIAEKMPVVACIRGVGASGSYMLSCAAQKIVANPSAIIGSIGVISVRPALQELLGRIGVGVNVNKSGKFKDLGAPWREVTQEENEKMQSLIDDSFNYFVALVAKARNMEEEDVRKLATGEVFWAPKAQELGLVDELGDLEKAIDIAAEMSGAPRKPVWIKPRRNLREMLFNPAAESLADSVLAAIENRLWTSSFR